MSDEHAGALVRRIARLAAGQAGGPPDRDLLRAFSERGDQAAFVALVDRHGGMVLRVCRRVLGCHHDAEDCFQAAFLVLARKAGSVRRGESLASWLHGVAYRIAMSAKRDIGRRRTHERKATELPAAARPAADPAGDVTWAEVRAALDDEIPRLPAAWRAPLVLCLLEGRSAAEAAGELGVTESAVRGRLHQAKQRLQARLARRGLTLSAALLAAGLATEAGAAVPAPLLRLTIQAVRLFTAGGPATGGPVSAKAAGLAERAGQSMSAAKLKIRALVLGAAGLVALGAGVLAKPEPPAALSAPAPAADPVPGARADDPALRPGKWTLSDWGSPDHPTGLAVLTVGEQGGKPAITAIEADDTLWQMKGLTVTGRRVAFAVARGEEAAFQFEGLPDPADSARVLGSVWWSGDPRATRAVLELAPAAGTPKRLPAPPAEWVKYLGVRDALADVESRAEGGDFGKKTAAEQAALRSAASAARERYHAEVVPLFRKLVAERPLGPYGYEAAMCLFELADSGKPTPEEVGTWAKAARAFAAAHGPRFEASTVGRVATTLARHAGYDREARAYAAEADTLAKAAGMPAESAAQVAWRVEERAAWGAQPNPPKAGSTWTVTVTGKVADGKGDPVAGAEVVVNNVGAVTLITDDGSFKTRTGPDGRYTITLKCQGTCRAHVTRMWAEKPGFVRGDNEEHRKLLPGQSAAVNFTLTPGEVFAGTVKFPPTARERDAGPDHQPVRVLTVTGPGVSETVAAHNGVKFELTLPPGAYTVEYINHRGKKFTWPGLKAGKTDHVFEPPPFAFTPETVGTGFDQMWREIDRHYSYFALKPDVDWAKLRDEYRPKAAKVKSAAELAEVFKDMLAHLKDGHVWIQMPDGEQVGTHRRPWTYNGNRKVVRDQLTDVTECGEYAVVGKTKPDGFGYFLMIRQGAATPELVAKAAAAIEKLSDAPGFVVDLRAANGGSEPLAQEVARLFCEKKVVYAKSRYRNGRGHDEFTEDFARELLPAKSGKPYLKPVVCLLGPGCVSSGEGFAKMMAALPHVTTVGLPTRGSSGNPGAVDVGETGLVVYFSRWVDLLPDGTPIEGKGVPPKVKVERAADAYRDADPTLERGIDVLRESARKTGRK